MRWTHPLASGFTYSLGNSLYVPLTSRCNSLTLPQTRGPNFLLPPAVVASLCRVRDVEEGTNQWKQWCMWLDMQETPQKLPEPLDTVEELEPGSVEHSVDGRRPTVVELMEEVESVMLAYRQSGKEFSSIVIGGEGEPMLRLDALEDLVRKIRLHYSNEDSSPSTTIRVTTNGLVQDAVTCTKRLIACGVNDVSVSLVTHDAKQYDELMQPRNLNQSSHGRVQVFLRAAGQVGLHVEATAVNRPDVDQIATEALAKSLGVASIRWRPYFS